MGDDSWSTDIAVTEKSGVSMGNAGRKVREGGEEVEAKVEDEMVGCGVESSIETTVPLMKPGNPPGDKSPIVA
jgi:hypothetical protein